MEVKQTWNKNKQFKPSYTFPDQQSSTIYI